MQFAVFIHRHHIARVKEPAFVEHDRIGVGIVQVTTEHLVTTQPQNADAVFVFITNFAIVVCGRATKCKRETFLGRFGNADWSNRFSQTVSLDKCQAQPFIKCFHFWFGRGAAGNQNAGAPAKYGTNLILDVMHDKAQANLFQEFAVL